MADHIFPIHDRLVSFKDRCQRLNQRPISLWFCGLSGSGKSTIAVGLEHLLFQKGYTTQVLDGDNIRSGINSNLGFSVEDRLENNRRVAEIAKLYNMSGLITINSFISPTQSIRNKAKEIIGASFFKEVYIKASLKTCEDRDVKGLYEKARKGEIKGFTGIDSPFEAPENPFLEIDTEKHTLEVCIQSLFKAIEPLIKI
ncbi:MAG: adenylyl-sulfate kinase [Saprospiraceae bacterium]|nr:adenylyl-sulfate kinase [Saprospiraceae bacterium]